MAISSDVKAVFSEMQQLAAFQHSKDTVFGRYYEGSQRLVHLGLAVPPELRAFETVVNWPRLYVDAIEQRQDVKMILRPGETQADPWMQNVYRGNNLAADLTLYRVDKYVYGRGFLCVGT